MRLLPILPLSVALCALGCDRNGEPDRVTPAPEIPVSRPAKKPTPPAPAPEPAPRATTPRVGLTTGQTLYVPVYSSVITGQGGQRADMAVTLSIRNTDRDAPITIEAVEYHGSDGKLLEAIQTKASTLGPLQSSSFLIKQADIRGGGGASYIIQWTAEQPVHTPIVETVNVNTAGNRAFAFLGPSRVLQDAGG